MNLSSDSVAGTTFVLVHGAWHGGWCWKKVTPLLRAAGYEVYTPTMTGLGERSHLLRPDVNLSTHVQDILNVLEFEDLRDVILVGHSYGGMVVSGVADRLPDQIAHLVYLDAFVPEDGKSLVDYAPSPERDELVQIRGEGWRYAYDLFGPIESRMGVTDTLDIAWLKSHLVDQPFATFTEKASLTSGADNRLPRTYIQLTDAPFFVEAANRIRAQGATCYEIRGAGHDAMITRPEALARLLLEIAQV